MHVFGKCFNFVPQITFSTFNTHKNMRYLLSAFGAMMMTGMVFAASGINYDGSTLELNNEFTRSECGTMKKSVMPETSGLACSRTTPGYLWAHGDENTGSNKKIVAVKPDGTLAMTVTISDDPGRDDWEDIATGVYNNKNYVFIGAIGDNDLKFKDNYYIYYFEEPAITSGTKNASPEPRHIIVMPLSALSPPPATMTISQGQSNVKTPSWTLVKVANWIESKPVTLASVTSGIPIEP